MFDQARQHLAMQTLDPAFAKAGPWHVRFQDFVRSLPRRKRLALNVSLARRLHIRDRFARRYLRGFGVEIGAQNVPTRVDRKKTTVEYVDVVSNDDLVKFHSLNIDELVPLAHICDAQSLHCYADRSLDFLIANHVLEHFSDPVSGLVEWFRVLKPGGRLFLTLPYYRGNAFDFKRTPVRFNHLMLDYSDPEGREARDLEHYREIAALLLDREPGHLAVTKTINTWLGADLRQHYHAWDFRSVEDAVQAASSVAGCKTLVRDAFHTANAFELLVILEKARRPSRNLFRYGKARHLSSAFLLARETFLAVRQPLVRHD